MDPVFSSRFIEGCFFSFLGVVGFSGKSNVVAGLAKSIRLYLQKHAFVKVSVKGRAKGTPVAEIVQQLEVSLHTCNHALVGGLQYCSIFLWM
jgi:hypothetical protein